MTTRESQAAASGRPPGMWGMPLLVLVPATPAQAHVKWFSRDADCAMPPLSPLQVVSGPEFLGLGLVSLVVMMGCGLLDRRLSRPGSPMLDAATRLDEAWAQGLAHLLRLGLAVFFAVAVVFFGDQPVFLTPELRASGAWAAVLPPLQLGIAVSLLWRRWAWLGAVGMVGLYAGATASYGWFHLMDYPVFLAAAAFVALDSLYVGWRADLGFALLRLGAGVTLMWAGAEKWLYPWWSEAVLNQELLAVRGGLSGSFFMAAAGWVEFCAAFALIFGRVGTQVAAWILLIPFVAAIPVFGVLDAIGHAPIIVVLLMLGLTRTRLHAACQGAPTWRDAARSATLCLLAALATVALYWSLQALAYRGVGRALLEDIVVAALLVLPLLLWAWPSSPAWGQAPLRVQR